MESYECVTFFRHNMLQDLVFLGFNTFNFALYLLLTSEHGVKISTFSATITLTLTQLTPPLLTTFLASIAAHASTPPRLLPATSYQLDQCKILYLTSWHHITKKTLQWCFEGLSWGPSSLAEGANRVGVDPNHRVAQNWFEVKKSINIKDNATNIAHIKYLWSRGRTTASSAWSSS